MTDPQNDPYATIEQLRAICRLMVTEGFATPELTRMIDKVPTPKRGGDDPSAQNPQAVLDAIRHALNVTIINAGDGALGVVDARTFSQTLDHNGFAVAPQQPRFVTTAADLDALPDTGEGRRLLAEATPGEWRAEYSGEQGNCVVPADAESTREAVCVTRLYHQAADAELIVWARNNLGALLDAADERDKANKATVAAIQLAADRTADRDRLRAENEQLRQERDAYAEAIGAVQDVIAYGGDDPDCDPIDYMAVPVHDVARALKAGEAGQ